MSLMILMIVVSVLSILNTIVVLAMLKHLIELKLISQKWLPRIANGIVLTGFQDNPEDI